MPKRKLMSKHCCKSILAYLVFRLAYFCIHDGWCFHYWDAVLGVFGIWDGVYIPPNGIIKICNFENPLNLEATDEDIYGQATICRKEVRGNVFVSSKAAYTPVNQND